MTAFNTILKCFFTPFLLAGVIFTSCGDNQSTLFVALSPEKPGVLFNNRIMENDSINILEEEYVFNGGGVLAADFDNNGLTDLFFTGNQVSNRLYLNKGNFIILIGEKYVMEVHLYPTTGFLDLVVNGNQERIILFKLKKKMMK